MNWYLHSKLKDHKKFYILFLPDFGVVYIGSAIPNMCTVLVSTIFVSLLGFVNQESFQDVLEFPFSLISMQQQLLELLMFLIVTFWSFIDHV